MYDDVVLELKNTDMGDLVGVNDISGESGFLIETFLLSFSTHCDFASGSSLIAFITVVSLIVGRRFCVDISLNKRLLDVFILDSLFLIMLLIRFVF